LLFYDTIGLNESDIGTVKAKDALKNMIKLIKNNKFCLIVYIKKKGAILNVDKENYKIVNLISKSIPKICVITNCELEDNPYSWYDQNKNDFIKNDMIFNDGLSGCFSHQQKAKDLFKTTIEESIRTLLAKINSISLNENINCYDNFHHLLTILKSIFVIIADFMKLDFRVLKDDFVQMVKDTDIAIDELIIMFTE